MLINLFIFQVDISEGPIEVDTSHIYHGQVLGDSKSHVFGSIHDGVFEGKIITSDDSYYIEKARHYFPNQSHTDKGFHSVIYKEVHVNDPYQRRRKGEYSNNSNNKWRRGNKTYLASQVVG